MAKLVPVMIIILLIKSPDSNDAMRDKLCTC